MIIFHLILQTIIAYLLFTGGEGRGDKVFKKNLDLNI